MPNICIIVAMVIGFLCELYSRSSATIGHGIKMTGEKTNPLIYTFTHFIRFKTSTTTNIMCFILIIIIFKKKTIKG